MGENMDNVCLGQMYWNQNLLPFSIFKPKGLMYNITFSCGGCHLYRPRSGISIHSVTLYRDSPQLLLSWWQDDPCCVQAQSGSDWATEKQRSSASSRQLKEKTQTEEKKTILYRLYSKNDRLINWMFSYKISLLWLYVCVCDCFTHRVEWCSPGGSRGGMLPHQSHLSACEWSPHWSF